MTPGSFLAVVVLSTSAPLAAASATPPGSPGPARTEAGQRVDVDSPVAASHEAGSRVPLAVVDVTASGGGHADTLLTIGRLQYDGGGDWYANPSSLPNLLAAVRERTGLPTAEREVTVRLLDANLRDVPYLYLTGHGNVRFSPAEREALRGYLLEGGFLHADDNYGLDESFREEVEALFPDRELVELPPDHRIFHVLYDFPEGLPKIHEHDGERPRALGIFHDERLVLLYTFESDLGDGWEDPDVHEDPVEVREDALRMGVNIFLHVLGQRAGSGP